MGDLVHPAPPFFDGFIACIHRQANAFHTKVLVELSDRWCGRLIDQRVVDIADSGPGIDTGKTIDGEDFLKPWLGGSYSDQSGRLERYKRRNMKLRAHWKVSRC